MSMLRFGRVAVRRNGTGVLRRFCTQSMKQSVNVVDGGAKNPLVLMVQMIQLSRVLELWDFEFVTLHKLKVEFCRTGGE